MKAAAWMAPVLGALLLAGCGGGGKAGGGAPVGAEASPPPPVNEVALGPEEQKQAGVLVEAVLAESLPEVLRASGRITVSEVRTWRVGAVTDGRIVQLHAGIGERVSEGQVLAHMYSHDVHESRAAYARALGELSRLKSAEAYALRSRDRAQRLYGLKAGSLEQMEHAEAEYRNAQAEVHHAETEVVRTKTHLEGFLGVAADLPAPVAGSRHDDADLIPIRSPASGTLLHRDVTIGTVVEPARQLFVITDLSSLWMIAAVQEEYLAKLRAGMPVRVSVQAYPERRFPGRILRLGAELDAQTRTVQVQVEVPNAGGLLRPEMYATAELELGGTRPGLFVPALAIQELKGHSTVFVRSGESRFEARPVETGQSVEGMLEITSGLKRGEHVVTRGAFILKSQLLSGALSEE